MSYRFKAKSNCVGGRHFSATVSIEDHITKLGQKLLFGKCVRSKRKKSMTVSDNTERAEGIGKSLKV